MCGVHWGRKKRRLYHTSRFSEIKWGRKDLYPGRKAECAWNRKRRGKNVYRREHLPKKETKICSKEKKGGKKNLGERVLSSNGVKKTPPEREKVVPPGTYWVPGGRGDGTKRRRHGGREPGR